MINQLKLKQVFPFTLSALFLALNGCGGESATIHEDPNAGIKTSTNGCEWSQDRCQPFVINYPISGLNFDCKKDTRNHFEVLREGNIFTGGCESGDKVAFYIQGENSSRRIHLGEVDLAQLGPLRVADQPIQISLLDIAAGMTGQAAKSMDSTDNTYKVAVALARLFQAIGLDNGVSKTETDIQAVELRKDQKNNLNVLNADVDVNDFLDGSYLTDLAPWLNVSSIVSEASAKKVIEQNINLRNVSLSIANFLSLQGENVDIGGFNGSSASNANKKTIANLYVLTDRQGYSTGYSVQWTGIPPASTGSIFNASMNLLTLASPIKSNTYSGNGETSIKSWINPLTEQIQTPLSLKVNASSTEKLNIYQGKILNQKMIAGNAHYYKQALGQKVTPPAENSSVYGRWNQVLNGESFTGNIDLMRVNPATFLENNIFKTVNTVRAGERYIFPLYATLTFKYDNLSTEETKVGIVIDENGDIRTNRSATSLASANCNPVQANYIDSLGVQQYRIGTTGATNSTDTDKSITVRMIFANEIFGKLDGAIVGFNTNFATLPSPDPNTSYTVDVVTSGARINLKRLLDDGIATDAINISDWRSSTTLASWDNMYAVSQGIYNAANTNISTQQTDLAKLNSGKIERIELLNCSTYKIK